MTKRILVITSCTGKKLHQPINQLTQADFDDPFRLSRREEELTRFHTTAGKMYTGAQHILLMRGIEQFRKANGQIDVAILSDGYGLIREHDTIAPYEMTNFNTLKGKAFQSWSKKLNIANSFQTMIKDYDMIFLLLGGNYLKTIQWPVHLRPDQKLIFFAGKTNKTKVLKQPGSYQLTVSSKEATRFSYGLVGLKGLLFARLLEYFVKHPDTSWEDVADDPNLIRTCIIESTWSKQAKPADIESLLVSLEYGSVS